MSLVFYLHGFLLPLTQSNYNSKLFKSFVLNIWLFLIIHSLREMLNVHEMNLKLGISLQNLLSILFSVFFLVITSFFNYYVFYRKEHFLLNKLLTSIKQNFQFFSSLIITSTIYVLLYTYVDTKIINRIYNALLLLYSVGFLFYLFLNFRYLGTETLLRGNRFVSISRIALVITFLVMLGMYASRIFYNIPTFLLLVTSFLIYNFQLYKYFNSSIMLFPIFSSVNEQSLYHLHS